MDTTPRADALLLALPEADRDRLWPLLSDGPAVMERLTGRRPHRSLLLRHARRGVLGVTLRTVCVGRTQMSCARWLVEHWLAVDAARRAAREVSAAPAPPAPARRRRAAASTTEADDAVLRRHGLAT